uniref:GABA type A receptor associated protein like 1 n=1 Tax=Myotis myotis TaxID=51298 RepID=A0A7J7Z2V4_MYOMY|nr:GABA type A receptor associated protein like 1 [Myotis myotis]
MRTTMRKTTFCTWPTVMRVCMGSEWWQPSRWEHLDSGEGEGSVWDVGKRSLAPAMEETEGEDTWKHCTVHAVIIFSPAQLVFFAASSAQGESMSGQSRWISFARGMERIEFHSIAAN